MAINTFEQLLKHLNGLQSKTSLLYCEISSEMSNDDVWLLLGPNVFKLTGTVALGLKGVRQRGELKEIIRIVEAKYRVLKLDLLMNGKPPSEV